MSSALWHVAHSHIPIFMGLLSFTTKMYSEYSVANNENMSLVIREIVGNTTLKDSMAVLTHVLKPQCNLSLKVNVYLDKQVCFQCGNPNILNARDNLRVCFLFPHVLL